MVDKHKCARCRVWRPAERELARVAHPHDGTRTRASPPAKPVSGGDGICRQRRHSPACPEPPGVDSPRLLSLSDSPSGTALPRPASVPATCAYSVLSQALTGRKPAFCLTFSALLAQFTVRAGTGARRRIGSPG